VWYDMVLHRSVLHRRTVPYVTTIRYGTAAFLMSDPITITYGTVPYRTGTVWYRTLR